MKCVLKNKKITNNYVENLLKERGIIKTENEYEHFLNPTSSDLIKPEKLDNTEEGFNLLMKHIKEGNRILIVVDPDVDGFTSASLMWLYLKENFSDYNFTLEVKLPQGKEHGFRTIVDDFANNDLCDLILMPDAGSNDFKEHKILKDLGYDMLIIDHHSCDEGYSKDAVIINNQLSKAYDNKYLSGAGVIYKFLQYCDEQLGLHSADNHIDVATAGIIIDMMDITSLENRYIITQGCKRITNEFLKELCMKTSIKKTEKLTPDDFSFYIGPAINALIRIGSDIDKVNLFNAFTMGEHIVLSNKKGHAENETETLASQIARRCINIKNAQKKEQEKAAEELDIQISNECLDDNKILIVNCDDIDVNRNLTGLIAMTLSKKYKKPVLLGRLNKNREFKGSGRGLSGTELTDFRQFLLDSNLMEFSQGRLALNIFTI